jgi:hypothetical protein
MRSFSFLGIQRAAAVGFVTTGLLTACGSSGDSPPGPAPDTAVPTDSSGSDTAIDSATTTDTADATTTETGSDADATATDTADAADTAKPPVDAPACADGGCAGGLTCCSGSCVDLTADPHNCGACGSSCTLTQFCSGTKCNEAVFANVCENAKATVVKDPYDPDNAAGHLVGTALSTSCVPATVVVEKDQGAAGVLDFSNRPLGGVGMTYVTGGGSFGQKTIDYMDKAALTPVFLTGDGTNITFRIRRTGTDLVSAPMTTLTDSHDYFFVELAVEPVSGTLCFSVQGMFGAGTAAGAYWASTEVVPKRATYTDAWYAYEWTDSGDKLPSSTDTFRLIAHGR